MKLIHRYFSDHPSNCLKILIVRKWHSNRQSLRQKKYNINRNVIAAIFSQIQTLKIIVKLWQTKKYVERLILVKL